MQDAGNIWEAMQSLIHNQTSQDAFIHTFIYPAGISSTLSLRGQFATESLTDERDDSDANRPIGLITEVQTNDPDGDFDGANVELSDGTSGFWGMGVYQVDTTISFFCIIVQSSF